MKRSIPYVLMLLLGSCGVHSTDDVAAPVENLAATRAALEQLREQGVDLSRERSINFQLAAPTSTVAYRIADAAAAEGFQTRVAFDEGGQFTVWCTRVMMPHAGDIARTETILDRLARHFGGYGDGWSTDA